MERRRVVKEEGNDDSEKENEGLWGLGLALC